MSITSPPRPRRSSAVRWIGSAAGAYLVLALAISAILEPELLRYNPAVTGFRDVALLFVDLSIIHAALILPVAVGTIALLALLGARRGAAPSPAAAALHVAAVGAGWVLVVNAVLRFTITYAPLRGGHKSYASPLGLANLVVFSAGLAVAFATCWMLTSQTGSPSARRKRAGRLVGGYLVVLALTLGINLVAERPVPTDMAAIRAPASSAPRPAPAHSGPDGVLVLGIDGLSWHVINALFAQGELPNFAAMVNQGARASFKTIIPTYSPIVWNTIVTGRNYRVHRMFGYTRFRLPGMESYLESAPLVSSINWVNGLNRILATAADRHWLEQSPVFSVEREVPALWDISDHDGVRTGVYNWLGTWPVTPLAAGSFMVNGLEDRPGDWHPEATVRRILAERKTPGAQADAGSRPSICPTLETSAGAGVALYQHFQPRLAMAWTSVDAVHHHFWRGAIDYDWLILPWRTSHTHFAPEILDCYRRTDVALGAWRKAIGPDKLLIVVSDHGYSFNGYEHHFAPDGVFLAAGPGVLPGKQLEDVTIYDLAPTVLRVMGLPLSRKLEGRVVDEMFRDGALPDARFVDDYDWYEKRELHTKRSLDVERREFEALKELGYVN